MSGIIKTVRGADNVESFEFLLSDGAEISEFKYGRALFRIQKVETNIENSRLPACGLNLT